MKKFLVKGVLFLLLQALIFLPFWNPAMPHEHDYLAATIDKHRRLRSTPSPRLILVGGSNLAFGINAQLLEHELGLPLVNMGLNSFLGIRFMLEEIEREIGPGDVVVLSLEYGSFARAINEAMEAQLVEMRPAHLAFLLPTRWRGMIDRYGFSILGGVVRRTFLQRFHEDVFTSSAQHYKRELFDTQGSYTGHYGKPPADPKFDQTQILKMAAEVQASIERFARHCRARGARCYYSCPPHPAPLLTPLPEPIQHNLKQLSQISELHLLDTPLEQSYPTNAFFDSSYHLTEAGANQRTRKLVEKLRAVLSARSPALVASSSGVSLE